MPHPSSPQGRMRADLGDSSYRKLTAFNPDVDENPVEEWEKAKKARKQNSNENRTWTLPEVTTVGSIGIGPFSNKPPQDPMKKRKRKTLSKFIQQSFKL